ncbi:paramyosin, short form-like [Agrilus planipennis]|uniref:Paramyosin, short form-like n=1 Tax=Agrilus planipennis TaxID=224129 RepID=A0A1W4WGU4_AGRPL|nr:paramyosin, short form-like [Agrilus planipennis]
MVGQSSASKRLSERVPRLLSTAKSIYEDNYSLGANYYKPVIDHLNKKDIRKATVSTSSCLSTRNSVIELNKKTKEILKDSKFHTKSVFRPCTLAEVSNSLEKVNPRRKKTRKEKELVRQLKQLKDKMGDAAHGYDSDLDKKVEYELKAMQKFLRGKSADGIAHQLLSESRKNVAIAQELDAIEKQQQSVFAPMCALKTTSRAHLKVMASRIDKKLEENLIRPLEDLSVDLKGFNRRTAEIFYDKR